MTPKSATPLFAHDADSPTHVLTFGPDWQQRSRGTLSDPKRNYPTPLPLTHLRTYLDADSPTACKATQTTYSKMAVANIPVIDISDPSQDETQIAKELVEAAIEHGFIYIKSTGRDMPIDAVQGAFKLVNMAISDGNISSRSHVVLTRSHSPRNFLPPRSKRSSNARCKQTTWA